MFYVLKTSTGHWAQDVKLTSNERRIQVCPKQTNEKHYVYVNSLSRTCTCAYVIFGRKTDVPPSSLHILNVQKTYTNKSSLNVESQRPLDVNFMT